MGVGVGDGFGVGFGVGVGVGVAVGVGRGGLEFGFASADAGLAKIATVRPRAATTAKSFPIALILPSLSDGVNRC